jgi:hypothetical protein
MQRAIAAGAWPALQQCLTYYKKQWLTPIAATPKLAYAVHC